MSEYKKQECETCGYYVYKGDDEQYCKIAHWRQFSLLRWQKAPKFCPINRRMRYDELSQMRKQQGDSDGLKTDT